MRERVNGGGVDRDVRVEEKGVAKTLSFGNEPEGSRISREAERATLLDQRKGRFTVAVEQFLAGATLGIHERYREHVVAETLHLPNGYVLIGKQAIQHRPDRDVFKFDHGTTVGQPILIVKPAIRIYPDCAIRYAP